MARSLPGRDALAPGARVQLSWIVHAPHTRRADRAVDDRLAEVVRRDGDDWIVLDGEGEEHRLTDALLEEAVDDPARARWRIEGHIPAFFTGERLQLRWRHRDGATPEPARVDVVATVIAERSSTVIVRLDDGSEIEMSRLGVQADAPTRKQPRWFVVGREP